MGKLVGSKLAVEQLVETEPVVGRICGVSES
jgi:hypothetical protein